MIGQLILQLALILVNAFFAATEIAVISLNEKKVKARAENGDKKAAKMMKMIEEPTRFLSTIQIGITLAGFLGSAFAADNFAQRLSAFAVRVFHISAAKAGMVNTVSVILITLILSFFTLVLGELVPKRIAMKHKEKLAEAVCGTVSGLAAVLRPAIWLLTVSTNGMIRLFGIDPDEKEEAVSEEDIVLMLDAGAEEGSIGKGEIRYIKNIFKFDGKNAEDVMTPSRNIVCIPHSASEAEILAVIEKEEYSRIPVYEDTIDKIVGVLHAGEYLIKYGRAGFTMDSVLQKPVFVPEKMHLDVLLREMQKEHNHLAIVVNEYGETAGIVTMEDILEELVGEIWDEHDEEISTIRKLDDGSYSVSCSASVEEFREKFRLAADEDTESTTVNGWLIEHLGDIPEAGSSFVYENLKITVTKVDEVMAHEIKVEVTQNADAAQ